MSTTSLSETDWNTVLGRIEDGKCTPFLGAGANSGILPSGLNLAAEWAREFSYPFADKHDLAKVAQFVAINRDQVWPKEEVLRRFEQQVAEVDTRPALTNTTHPLAVLADLPLPVFMTTNYDGLMCRALTYCGKTPRVDLCRWNEFLRRRPSILEGRNRVTPTVQAPVVFHLHGHQDFAESVVLTEDDYLDFLISMSRHEELLPARIQEALSYSSLLFVGYRLADLNFRVLFRGLLRGMEDCLRRTSIAVQMPPQDGPEAQAYLDHYFSKLNVKVYWGDAAGFVTELRQRWEQRQK